MWLAIHARACSSSAAISTFRVRARLGLGSPPSGWEPKVRARIRVGARARARARARIRVGVGVRVVYLHLASEA